jgi:hypothetical protein
MSHIPAPKPRKPRISVNAGEVCSQRSIKYPAPPAITIDAIMMKGSSSAKATWFSERFGILPGEGDGEAII